MVMNSGFGRVFRGDDKNLIEPWMLDVLRRELAIAAGQQSSFALDLDEGELNMRKLLLQKVQVCYTGKRRVFYVNKIVLYYIDPEHLENYRAVCSIELH